VAFSVNGTNAAKNTTATFSAAGNYTFLVTITDSAGLKATSSVMVTVSQNASSLSLSPANVNLVGGATQQFTATMKDQFGNAMSSQPAYAWTLTGGGALSNTGLYTAPGGSTTATVQASGGGMSKTASVTVTGGTTALKPGINFNAATGVLTFQGTVYNDSAQISVVSVNGVQTALLSFQATDMLGNIVLQQTQQIPLSQIKYIYFYGQTGVGENFYNYSAIPSTAYGGSGNNFLLGGSSNDVLYGGPAGSNNTLKGMAGDDTLVGGAGNNWLYGGAGNNTLTPGPGPGQNFLFPNS
jgi:Ca2+-binding RTX toxin-like protein